MPIYAMRCDSCGKESDIYRSVAKMDDDLPSCCGEIMRRKICAPFVQADIQTYKSMVDGSMIDSRTKHREHLKRHGMVEVGNEAPKVPKREAPKNLKKDLYETFTGFGY